VPWSARLLRRSRLAVQGTLLAARAALRDGLGGNLAGGTHHAFADRGEGFCVLNDVAIAVCTLRAGAASERAMPRPMPEVEPVTRAVLPLNMVEFMEIPVLEEYCFNRSAPARHTSVEF
jgi:hypothetical protein